jgi:hypothetical protein
MLGARANSFSAIPVGSRYVGTRTRDWLKIKNPTYSQAEGRKNSLIGGEDESQPRRLAI